MEKSNPAINFLLNFQPRTDTFVSLHTMLDRYTEHLLMEAGTYTFPVDLEKVFDRYRLQAKGNAHLEQHGAITPDLDIFYNASDPRKVQLFSLAHELIEALIYAIQDENGEYDPDWLTFEQIKELLDPDRKEIYCDYGAAALLMPMDFFKPYVEQFGFSMQTAIALTRSTGLSLTSTARRMLETGLREAAFIVWRYGHAPTEVIPSEKNQMILPLWDTPTALDPPKKLRIDYSFASSTMNRYIRQHKSVENDTAIARALEAVSGSIVRGYDKLEICSQKGCYLTESVPAAYDGQSRVMSFVYFDDRAEEQLLLD
jgi:Zn-dependent peptidase ImmA (M78 family)